MSLDPQIRASLTLPVICAPMFQVTGPNLVREACKAGLIAGLPRQNARSMEEFEDWMGAIRRGLDAHAEENAGARIGPIAVNIGTRMPAEELRETLDICKRNGVGIFITVGGDPTEIAKRVHECGGLVFHDVTSIRFAERAMRANADGLTCIGAGGGGHSGTISHLALIPQIRARFNGTIVLAGAVSTGAVVRAAEILGAGLAYMGTRFIATQESDAPEAYKHCS
jgi:nitronate monooxygenase